MHLVIASIIGAHGSVCRDIEERGRDLEQVLKQYIHLVKPAFEEFTLPVCYDLPSIALLTLSS